MVNTPGERLIDVLEQLRVRLGKSGVERTAGLKDSLGDDCGYYKRSLKKFIDEDYQDVSNLVKRASDLIEVIK
jgi:hypothetical protein